jgi:hypothetical protein
MLNASSNLPENNTKINIKLFLLDPLSVIIKLAILGNKPIGTKILIQNNVIYFQEPGIFQSITRMFYNSNKTDLQYMYNPIHIACSTFLSKEFIQKTPRLKSLFVFAQNGLKNLIETYKNCSIISLCLNYYYAIITIIIIIITFLLLVCSVDLNVMCSPKYDQRNKHDDAYELEHLVISSLLSGKVLDLEQLSISKVLLLLLSLFYCF